MAGKSHSLQLDVMSYISILNLYIVKHMVCNFHMQKFLHVLNTQFWNVTAYLFLLSLNCITGGPAIIRRLLRLKLKP